MGVKKYKTIVQSRKAKYKQQQAYHERATKLVGFRFMIEGDKDVLDRLNAQSNKTDYLRRLIRKDIEDNKE